MKPVVKFHRGEAYSSGVVNPAMAGSPSLSACNAQAGLNLNEIDNFSKVPFAVKIKPGKSGRFNRFLFIVYFFRFFFFRF